MANKKLIICSDGTWQKINVTYPTNVAKIKEAIEAANSPDQQVFYDPGVGTRNRIAKLFGGAFGWGLKKNIKDCYRFLCNNYKQGNSIYLFGFSRGAYTVRSLAGLIYKCGLLKKGRNKLINRAMRLYRDRDTHPDDSKAVAFRKKYSHSNPETDNRPLITFLGCWDTVGALGVPDISPKFTLDKKINRKYKFHDTKLSNIIQHARHAVAIDERRKVFDVTPMTQSNGARERGTDLKQVWFTGDHGCIGGGEKVKEPLSDIALYWMMQELLSLKAVPGLSLDESKIPNKDELKYMTSFDNSIDSIFKATGEIDRNVTTDFLELYWSVKARLKKDLNYNALVREMFRTDIAGWTMEPDDVAVAHV